MTRKLNQSVGEFKASTIFSVLRFALISFSGRHQQLPYPWEVVLLDMVFYLLCNVVKR
ncbi:MAG: hypothetical protein HEQ35_23345 [Gloeotrichia echinulata IR180]|nr:hypothetical protein [Gloeotrichia echinulata DEX184]MCM0593159.1 hypothetical protein [Gloeotrichia echinulata DEX184]MCM0593502.1 hypothetical protein [Gloeotrichia echinulata DEX184]